MKPGKRLKTVLIVIAVIIAAIIIGAALYVNHLYSKINRVTTSSGAGTTTRIPREEETFEINTSEPDTIEQEEVEDLFDVDSIDMMKDDDIRNILLIGQDAREGEERQRSDTMIICSINTHTDKVTLASLMRDMYVPIPGYSNNRINAAYAFGGMELLDEVIEQDFGIPIDGNVEVDFAGFVEAMEVIGGVDVELTLEEAWYLSNAGWEDQGEFANDGTWDLQEGMNTLTPEQALSFARIRHVGNSDWERTDRQRRVIMAALSKIRDSSTAKQLSLADSILPYITTDLSGKELLSFVKTIAESGITDVESYRIPADGTYSSENISGMSVLVPDLVKNSELLKEYLYGEDQEPEFHDDEDKEDEKDPDDKTGTKTSQSKRDKKNKTKTGTGSNAGNAANNSGTYTAPAYTAAPVYVQPVPAATAAPAAPAADTDGRDNVLIEEPAEEPVDTGTVDPGTAADPAQGTVPDQGTGGTDAGTVPDPAPADTGGGDVNVEPAVPAAPEPAAPAPAAEVPAAPVEAAAPIPAEGGA